MSFQLGLEVKSKYILVLVIICTLIITYLLTDKRIVLNAFIVEGDVIEKPDLLILLEGGSIRFAPTRERAEETIRLYKQHPGTVLICAYRNYKKDIRKYLINNGIKASDIVESFYDYDGKKGGGTYNNVLEVLSVIKKKNNIQNIVIVTSPYHELRVSILFSELIKQAEINKPIFINYSNINDSEAIHTDTPRFISIISHELQAISWFYIMQAYEKVVKNLEIFFSKKRASGYGVDY